MPTKPGSWRDKKKGDCFTTKGGAVVCEGSAGMGYKAKNPTGKQTGKTAKKEKEKEKRMKAEKKRKKVRKKERKDYKKPTPSVAPPKADMVEDIRLFRWSESSKKDRTYGQYEGTGPMPSWGKGTTLKKTETDIKKIKNTQKWKNLGRGFGMGSELEGDRRKVYKIWTKNTKEGKKFKKALSKADRDLTELD
tara:strand:- start:106 stop:681 length:576 start_codon:yes stop_codon:yes gene_type:complete